MLIAVDGGATHCRLAVFDASGERLEEQHLPQPASLSVGVEKAVEAVRDGIQRIEASLGRSLAGVPLACGLAGSLRETLTTAFIHNFARERTVDVVTDGHAQLLGATGGQAGCCLSVGTGSVLHWQDQQGAFGMAGGWGYPVGDEGSAAWLGMQLLREYVRVLDRGEAITPLWSSVAGQVGTKATEIQAWTTCSNSTQSGSLAVLVSAHAQQADPDAMKLLAKATDECEQLIDCAPAALPRWLCGGMSEVYRPLLEARGHRIEDLCGDALDGLRLHAVKRNMT